ncbi:MAG: IS256 family transposase [Nitrospira sp.]|nr:IS256 family transposase [Nitrospira sp.]
MGLIPNRSNLNHQSNHRGGYEMALHYVQTYFDRKRHRRETLQMLSLSGVVRPSHVEVRYTTPLLKAEEQTDFFLDNTVPLTSRSSLLTQFVEFIRPLIAGMQSLRPYLCRGISLLGVQMASRRRSHPGEPSTTALVVTGGSEYAAMLERVCHGMVESRAVWDDTPKQWVRGKSKGRLHQILDGDVTTFLGGVQAEHRCEVAPVDLPAGSRHGCGKPDQSSRTGGTVTVLRPRILDLAERFERKVLPLLTHRPRKGGHMPSGLYVQGLSTEDFDEALQNLLGEGAPLPASSIQRLKMFFQLEYDAWRKRDLSHLAIAYWWADGLYVKVGVEDHKSALLTIVGTLITGERIVLACDSGKRESKESWLKLLRDLKHRGLTFPRLTVADGRLGLWAALDEIHPSGEQQGCWNRKIASVLKTLPKDARPKASERLKAMAYAETQAECERRRDKFVRTYRKTEGKAVETLLRDWERMVTFYAFPQEHWRHLRTTNIVVSPFDSVQLRANASRRYTRVAGAKAIMWKILRVAEKSWRKLHGPELLPLVASGVTFKDGVMTQSGDLESAVIHQSERTAA